MEQESSKSKKLSWDLHGFGVDKQCADESEGKAEEQGLFISCVISTCQNKPSLDEPLVLGSVQEPVHLHDHLIP